MSKKLCFDKLRAITPKEVRDSVLREMIDDIEQIKKASELSDGTVQNFFQNSKAYLDDKRLKLANHRKDRALDLLKNRQIREFITAAGEEQITERMFGMLGGSNLLGKGVNRSVDRLTNSKRASYQNALLQGLRDKDLLDTFKGETLNREIMQDLWALSTPGAKQNPSGSKEAFDIAKVINATQEMMLQDLRFSGADVGRVRGYVMRQSHDSSRLKDAGVREWAQEIMPHLDLERTFGEKANDPKFIQAFLEEAHNDIVNGKFEQADVSDLAEEIFATRRPVKIGNKVSKSRKLHFKSGDEFFKYNEKFGRKSLSDNILASFDTNARNSTLIDFFGSDPLKGFSDHIKFARSQLKDNPKALKKFDSAEKQLRNLFEQVRGTTSIPSNELAAKINQSVRAANNMSKLGKAAISAMTDLSTSASILRSATGKGFLRSHLDLVLEWSSNLKTRIGNKKEFQRQMQNYGLLVDTHVGAHYSAFGADAFNNIPGVVSKLQRQFFALSGITAQTELGKLSFARVFSKEASDFANKSFNQLPDILRANMERFNIDDKMWDIIRRGVDDLDDGFKGITLEKIRSIEGIDPKIKREAELAWQSYIVDHAELASPTPNARVRNRIIRGTQPGDFLGEVLRHAGQFKSFPLTMYDVMSRVALSNPAKGGEKLSDLLRGRGDIQGVMGLMAGATALAYVSMTVKSLAANKTPPPPDDLSTWRDALIRGGSMGLYGDFLLGEYDRFGSSLSSDVLGPTFGQVDDAFKIYSKAMAGKNVGKNTWRLIERNLPYQNLFYLRTSLDYLFLDTINETMNPGYKTRRRQRLQKENREPIF